MIPRKTHQIWFQGWEKLPPKYIIDVKKLSILNQNWEHMKWDEESLRAECEKFSRKALDKFDRFDNMIQKIDFGRYIVLYNYGGVSVDCDAECLRPLDKIPGFDRHDLIISKNPLNNTENMITTYGLSKGIVIMNNATLCCSKNNSMIKTFIEFLIKNESWNEDQCLDTQLKTGPLILSIFFNNYIDDILVLDADVFEPYGNINRLTILNHKYDQTWTGYGALHVKAYKLIKNNLIIILLVAILLTLFFGIKEILKYYKRQLITATTIF